MNFSFAQQMFLALFVVFGGGTLVLLAAIYEACTAAPTQWERLIWRSVVLVFWLLLWQLLVNGATS